MLIESNLNCRVVNSTSETLAPAGGSNPGNLGQDIRKLENNNNLIINTTGGIAGLSHGDCN